jgi:hypothetical protein
MQHMKKKKRPKAVRLALALTVMLLLPISAFAQDGLFQRGMTDEAYYGYASSDKSSLLGNRNVQTSGTINNQIFGQEVPVGSGVILLLAAGAGYAILKRKEDEQ